MYATVQATKLAEALKENTSLTSLKLRYNEIRDDGAKALAGVIEVHPNLQSMTLGNNIIGSEGAGEIAVRTPHLPAVTGAFVQPQLHFATKHP